MLDLSLELLEPLRYVSVIVAICVVIAAVVSWAMGIAPALLRLGRGLAGRRIAIFAKGDMAGSLKSLLLDSRLFKERNIIMIGHEGDIEKGQLATLFVVYWPDWSEYVHDILKQKSDGAALILYAPQDKGLIPRDMLATLNEKRNVMLCNFRGRLLNDIIGSMITTSYEKR